MKPKFKPGDVVEFTAEMRDIIWANQICKRNGCHTFFVHSYVERPKTSGSESVHLAPISGKRLRWCEKSNGERRYGIYEGWLQKNEFLTAVHKAQKQKEKYGR